MAAVAGRGGPGFLPPRTTYSHCREGTTPGVMPQWPADLSSLRSPLCPSFSLPLLSYPFCSTLQLFLFTTVQFLHFLFLPILCSHSPFIWLACPQHPGVSHLLCVPTGSPSLCVSAVCPLVCFQIQTQAHEGKTMSDLALPLWCPMSDLAQVPFNICWILPFMEYSSVVLRAT